MSNWQYVSQHYIELSEHDHHYCCRCNRVMLYHKDNGVCFDCDIG